jgi:uncharacterized protein involved in exopolysaccharide biosynthesis
LVPSDAPTGDRLTAQLNQRLEPPQPLFDFKTFVEHLWFRRWGAILIVLMVTGLAAGGSFLLKPQYQATVVLVPTGSGAGGLGSAMGSALGSLGGLASLAGVSLGGGDASVEENLAFLRSREFTVKFIRENDLTKLLFADIWNSEQQRWKVPTVDVPSDAACFKLFDQRIRFVSQDRKSSLVTVRIQWTNPSEAASWANRLVAVANSELRARAISRANSSIKHLQAELGKTSEIEIREAINRLIETQVRQRMLATVNSDYAFRVIDPAAVPDRTDRVSPNRVAITLVGGVVGCVLALVWVLFLLVRAKAFDHAGATRIRISSGD